IALRAKGTPEYSTFIKMVVIRIGNEMRDLIIFDTALHADYYSDVHSLLALPYGSLLTYDYGEKYVSEDAIKVLEDLSLNFLQTRVVLCYVQDSRNKKSDYKFSKTGKIASQNRFQKLTRYGEVILCKKLEIDGGIRYYLDIKLLGYPYDIKNLITKHLVDDLYDKQSIPMEKFILTSKSYITNGFFSQKKELETAAFDNICKYLTRSNTQFCDDTFWRIVNISIEEKSIIPFIKNKKKSVPLHIHLDKLPESKSFSYIKITDQSTLDFKIQFYADKTKKNYVRRILTLTSSKNIDAFLINERILSRATGYSNYDIKIPTSLSLRLINSEIRLKTSSLNKDEEDYPVGPEVYLNIKVKKKVSATLLAISSTVVASCLFAYGALSTGTLMNSGHPLEITPISIRVACIGIGVVVSAWAYYLWHDELSIDKIKRG
ncbi:hypothetical protein, partial [Pantoea ananatis]|uniref:hypothetical protein n=3 Tax=Pantoea ananas TaxID=553 RepID=UPI0021F7EC41